MTDTSITPLMWPSITGKKIVIVGGGSGIGLGGAKLFATLGAHVVIAGRTLARLEKAASELGSNVSVEQVDGQSAESVAAMFDRIGPFDHLVITLAGRLGGGTFADVDLNEFRQAFEQKFWPHLLVAQGALKTLSKTGSLTFITGASARKVSPGGSGFGAMNGALEIMTPTLARELAPLRVNAISPGFVVTPWYDHLPEAEVTDAVTFAAQRLPVGRVGTSEDLAQAMLYVLGTGFVTGSVIECDGGARVANDTPETGLPREN